MKNILFLLLCLWFSICSGQEATTDTLQPEVNLIGAYTDTRTIILRWVPSGPSVWSYSAFYGYKLERCEIDTIAGTQSPWKTLGDSIRKPITLDQWKTLVSKHPDDLYLQAAGQAHHGERSKTGESLSDLIKKSDEFRNYYAAAMLSSEFSALAAEASAMRYEDREILPGKLYVYRIHSLCPDSLLSISEGITSVSTEKVESFPEIIMDQVYEGEKLIEISWDKRVYSQFYSAFNIYRSSDSGRTWMKLNQIPFAFVGLKNENLFFYRDSLDQNYTRMQYQLEGITPYAIVGPKSKTIEAMGRDRTPPSAPFNLETKYLGNNRMKITWEVDPADTDIAGFRISKSNQANEGFMELTNEAIAKDMRTFIDTACNELINNYYYVGVFDIEGNVNVGFPEYGTIIDSVPPARPTGLTGTIDTNGVVTLTWKLGPEPDLKGYYIHSTNRENQTFANRTNHPVQDTIWKDTIPLNVLTEKIYYKVVAIDMRSNYSGYSDLLILKKPDLVPPVAPVLRDVRNDKNQVKISWYNSTSHDVVENVLQRRSDPEEPFKRIYACKSDLQNGSYTDLNVEDGKKYEYRIYAIDDAGLMSDMVGTMNVTAYIDKTLARLETVEAIVNTAEKKLELVWKYEPMQDIQFAIYRSLNGSAYQSYKVVRNQTSFGDMGFKNNDVVRYKIKVINAKGWHSEFSKEVVASFETD